ncbi:MAG: hypothetical protein O2940_03115, partial [Actinomycetota bacterium]|nr:hypothetical protein [Actinomycetota bacterium]
NPHEIVSFVPKKGDVLVWNGRVNSSTVSDVRTNYYDDDDVYFAPSLDELAQDWGYNSWGEFSQTID